MSIIHLDPTPEIKSLAHVAFPSYKGRKFKLNNSGKPVNIKSYWDGGSRNYFVVVNLANKSTLSIRENGTIFNAPIAKNGFVVPAEYVIVEHSIFMGKDSGITFHVDPNTATAFLPDTAKVNQDETIVLKYTSRYKNTYGGETNIRYKEAKRETGISQDAWNTALASLKTSKLLNKAGAITTAGRNAIA